MADELLCADGWELVYKHFKGGDSIIFIDAWDVLYYGTLMYLPGPEGFKKFILKSLTGKLERHSWADVRFMSHDGFPIKKLTGADGSKLVEQIDTTEVQQAIRNVIDHILCYNCKTMILEEDAIKRRGDYYCSTCVKTIVFRDPYIIEGVNALLLNKGNEGEFFTNHPDEECIFLTAKDGAKGILYETSTIFHWS